MFPEEENPTLGNASLETEIGPCMLPVPVSIKSEKEIRFDELVEAEENIDYKSLLKTCMSDNMPPYDSFENEMMLGDVIIKCERIQDEQPLNYYDDYMNDDLWSDRKILLGLGNKQQFEAPREATCEDIQNTQTNCEVQQNNFETNARISKKRGNKNNAKRRKSGKKRTTQYLVQDFSDDSNRRCNQDFRKADAGEVRANSNWICSNKKPKLNHKAKKDEFNQKYSGEMKGGSKTTSVTTDICRKETQTQSRKPYTRRKPLKEMTRHKGTKSSASTSAFPCELCSNTFETKLAYRKHYFTHTGQQFVVCAVCDGNFVTRRSLQTHIRTVHEVDMSTDLENKPISCDECDARFACYASAHRHTLVHTGERPYQCNRCDATFMQSGSLNRHLASHAGMKSHKCTKCRVVFTRKSSLDRHVLSHDEDRPFACDKCGKGFTRKYILEEHTKIYCSS